MDEHQPFRKTKKKAIAGFYAWRHNKPVTSPEEIIPALPFLTEEVITVYNEEGESERDKEGFLIWRLPNFGRDADYWDMWSIYKRFVDGRGYAYQGGWAEQLAIHDEVIDLFLALDASIERPKSGDS
jgi:hypothetical protein